MAQSILVPIAPGGQGSHLPRAAWLARHSGAEIILLCVSPAAQETAEDGHEKARLMAALDAPGISVRWASASGSPPQEILNVARAEMADLIVMETDPKWHAESGRNQDRAFQRFLLRSTVARVVQDAPCPVWLDRPAGTMTISRLVCALDLKTNCERLIAFASRTADACETRPVLFHSTASTRIFAPGQPRNVVELQRHQVEMAKNRIDQLQAQCATSAAKIVTSGDEVQALHNVLKDMTSPLVVLERVSDRWGDNHRIFRIVRHCKAPVLIRAEAAASRVPVSGPRKSVDPFFLLLAAIGIGASLIYLALYLAAHTDQCHFAAIRCQTPMGVLFPTNAGPAATP